MTSYSMTMDIPELFREADIEVLFVRREKDRYRIEITEGLFDRFTLLDKTAAVSLLKR